MMENSLSLNRYIYWYSGHSDHVIPLSIWILPATEIPGALSWETKRGYIRLLASPWQFMLKASILALPQISKVSFSLLSFALNKSGSKEGIL